MLRIDCPFCGPRPETEFQCAGDASRRRPAADADDAAWAAYLYLRSNPKGQHRERWLHQSGCGQWFEVVRDTVTHEIVATAPFSPATAGDAV